jgi:hypothetical protein
MRVRTSIGYVVVGMMLAWLLTSAGVFPIMWQFWAIIVCASLVHAVELWERYDRKV